MALTPEPACYSVDTDEMTAGQLAVLADLRRRLTDRGLTQAVPVVDDLAAELAETEEE